MTTAPLSATHVGRATHALGRSAAGSDAGAGTTRPLRLLLIDDDEDVCVLIRALVARAPGAWLVDWASTFEAGVAGLASGRYDVALLDYYLGARTGAELLDTVRSMEGAPPILMLTGRGSRAMDLEVMATGAAGYLDKGGLRPAQLERALRHAIGRGQAVAALLQTSIEASIRERVAFAAALARFQARDTPEATGQDITAAAAASPGVDVAALLAFDASGGVRVLAATAPYGIPVPVGELLPPQAGAFLIGRAARGPWVETALALALGGRSAAAFASMGLKAVAMAPIGPDDEPIGLLALGTTDATMARQIERRLPAAIEFAAAARSLIAAPLAARRGVQASREQIGAIIATERFEIHYQPVVDLASGRAIGYEALSRFIDRRPDIVFAEAAGAGVGSDLEAATLAVALRSAVTLPSSAWLALNVSPSLILDGTRLGTLLQQRNRPIVLEITEHDAIDDYPAIRAAIAALGPNVRIAVDDAGSGVANFAHIVELRPEFVKIDIGLVRGVDQDVTRQALIRGLLQFAHATNGWIIAEGVETEAERDVLLDLGLDLGQGYLFGRPAPAKTWA